MMFSKLRPSSALTGSHADSEYVLLTKLSLRNAKRQARDYLVYFITLVMSAALMYAFNNLIFSEEVQILAINISALPLIIVFASIVVVCIIGWLVSYTTGFMLQRRSREFGTYILIGLENEQVARLFLLENLVVGGFALIAGIPLGSFLFQAMRAIILAMFGMTYAFAFSISPKAALLAILYFMLIFLSAQRKSRKSIRSMKIYDLIYFEKHHEDIVIQTSRKRRRIFTASLVLGFVGTLLLLMGNMLLGVIGAGCIIAFLYGFFLSFASGVPAFFAKRPARKYQGQTLLVFRTLTAKLATVGTLMATISLLFTAVLISEGTGQCFNALFWGRAEWYAFDLFISIKSEAQDHAPYLDYIESSIPVQESRIYSIYLNDNAQVLDYIDKQTEYYHSFSEDTLMKYSDYAALRKIMGYPPAALEPGSYLVHCMPFLEKMMQEYDNPVAIGDRNLTPCGVYTEPFTQTFDSGNGCQYLLVVPDEVLAGCTVSHRIYAARTCEPVSEEQFQALQRIQNDTNRPDYDWLCAKSQEEAEAASCTVLFVFPLYYLALILTMTAAAILTIQQLAESDRYRKQFALLKKLGMSRSEMTRALRGQFVIYYAMPAIPPVLIGVPFVYNLGNEVEPGTLFGFNSPLYIVLSTLILFFIIYAVYIVLAYTGLKRNVLPEQE